MPDRIVRAGILTSESVNKLDWPVEVFYRRLMSVADDFGRFDGRTSILRAQLYALKIDRVSEPDLAKWIACAQKAGLVRMYTVEDKPYLEIVKFDQRKREGARSRWPDPLKDEDSSTSPRPAATRRESPPMSESVSVVVSDCVVDPPKPPERSALQLRLGGLFGRRPGTEWSDDELKKFRKLKPDRPQFEEEIRLIEWFYALNEKPNQLLWRRKDLATLLNNWNGEMDKARAQRGFDRDLGGDLEAIPTPEQIERARKNQALI